MGNNFLLIKCPHCNFSSPTDKSKIPDRTIAVTCPQCKGRFSFNKEQSLLQTEYSCPTCGELQEQGNICIRCGLVFSKYAPAADVQTRLNSHKEPDKNIDKTLHSPKNRSFITTIFLVIVLIVVIIYAAFFTEKMNFIAKLFITTSWQYDLRNFKNGQPREDIEKMLKKDNFRFSCRPSRGIQADDRTLCRIEIEKVWGIPAVGTDLFYDSNNVLTSVSMLFTEDKQDIVNKKLEEMAVKTPYVTRDKDGEIRERWKTDTGYIITSNRPGTKGFMIYWLRSDLAPAGWSIERYSWKYDFLSFHKWQTIKDIEKMLAQDGYTYECKEQRGIAPTDTSLCFVLLREAWGIPATVAELFFDANRNLTSIVIRFVAEQYPNVIGRLDKMGPRIKDNFKDEGASKKTATWKLSNGYIHMIHKPGDGKDIMIYWLNHDLAK